MYLQVNMTVLLCNFALVNLPPVHEAPDYRKRKRCLWR
jgi:hypothetical protein